jgi:hypothetical protein
LQEIGFLTFRPDKESDQILVDGTWECTGMGYLSSLFLQPNWQAKCSNSDELETEERNELKSRM